MTPEISANQSGTSIRGENNQMVGLVPEGQRRVAGGVQPPGAGPHQHQAPAGAPEQPFNEDIRRPSGRGRMMDAHSRWFHQPANLLRPFGTLGPGDSHQLADLLRPFGTLRYDNGWHAR
jgi:hypothetical protein